MAEFNKLSKVSDSFTVHRYDNWFMIEQAGRDENNDWKNCRVMCYTEEELFELMNELFNKDLDE